MAIARRPLARFEPCLHELLYCSRIVSESFSSFAHAHSSGMHNSFSYGLTFGPAPSNITFLTPWGDLFASDRTHSANTFAPAAPNQQLKGDAQPGLGGAFLVATRTPHLHSSYDIHQEASS